MKKLLYFTVLCTLVAGTCSCKGINEPEDDCGISGMATVLNSSGRTSCEWVQLWADGPKWATFNVGATISDYAHLTLMTDTTPCYNYADLAPYYNTANVGGLYAWESSNDNSRQTVWLSSVSTGVCDVAATLWGKNWKTPNQEQLDTLRNENDTYGKTIWSWCDGITTQYVAGCTLAGYRVSGVGTYAEQSIFLPAAGMFYCDDGTVGYASEYGLYWSSTEFNSDYSVCLYFCLDTRIMPGYACKHGLSVRAILAD